MLTAGLFCSFLALFLVMPLLLLFVYHLAPTVVAFALVICLSFSIMVSLFLGHPIFGGLCFAMVLVGTALGLHSYYAAVMPARALQNLPSYGPIYPSEPAIAYRDAAILRFTEGTIVDDRQAASLASPDGGFHTYCVAPVADPSSTGSTEYWAVGIDCCGPNEFTCDEAGDARVHTGVVVQDPNELSPFFPWVGRYVAPPLARRDLFERAVKKAEALHGIEGGTRGVQASKKKYIFVQWLSASREQLIEDRAVGSILLVSVQVILALVAAIGLARAAAHSASQDQEEQERELETGDGGLPPRSALLGVPAEPLKDACAERMGFVEPEKKPRDPLRELMVSALVWAFMIPYASFLGSVLVFSGFHCPQPTGHRGTGSAFVFGTIADSFVLALLLYLAVLLALPRWRLYGVFLVAISLTGSYAGHLNYMKNTGFYCESGRRREYSNVRPEAKAEEYRDAGIVHFSQSAVLGKEMSLGLLLDGVVYCAAPILEAKHFAEAQAATQVQAAGAEPAASEASGQVQAATPAVPAVALLKRAEFWAVGENCCAREGGFHCDQAEDVDSRSGAVLREPGEPWLLRVGQDDEIKQTVRATAERYDIELPKKPILVRWGKDLDKIRLKWLSSAIGRVIVMALGALVLFVVTITAAFICAPTSRRRQ